MSPSTRRAWIEIGRIRVLVCPMYGVALHPEGVDRNKLRIVGVYDVLVSPSTRRAWIEIVCFDLRSSRAGVALHPEGVDRNEFYKGKRTLGDGSPSTRRAWIEMT